MTYKSYKTYPPLPAFAILAEGGYSASQSDGW
jgi:hypothetical protein